MKGQETVMIANPSRSTSSGVVFEQEIFQSLWEKKEAKLKSQGWILKDDIKEIRTEVIEDGKGIDTFETVEEAEAPAEEKKAISRMSKAELIEECTAKGIEFHHAAKREKLIELLKNK